MNLITGEADAIVKGPGDTLKSGSFVVAGRAWAQLTQVGPDAYAAKLSAGAKKNVHATESEMMRSLDRLIRVVGFAPDSRGMRAVLPPVSDAGHGLSNLNGIHSRRAHRHDSGGTVPADQRGHGCIRHEAGTAKVLVQDMNCIETLARVDVLCVDKTGTITEPKMEVQDVIPLDPQKDSPSSWKPSWPLCTAALSRKTTREGPWQRSLPAKQIGNACPGSPSTPRQNGPPPCLPVRALLSWAPRSLFWARATRASGKRWSPGPLWAAGSCSSPI